MNEAALNSNYSIEWNGNVHDGQLSGIGRFPRTLIFYKNAIPFCTVHKEMITNTDRKIIAFIVIHTTTTLVKMKIM